MNKNLSISKPLTWNELAAEYEKYHPSSVARTLPLHMVFEWVEAQTDRFHVDLKEGTIHRINNGI